MVASSKDDLIGRVSSRYPDDGAWLAVVHNSERVDGCRCPTCGKTWPPSHVTCPEDGAILAARTSREAHAASPTQEAFGFDTSIDVAQDRESNTGTGQFDPFSSDISTYRAHRPPFDEPARIPGTKSSDPPTSFVRRLESHVELPPGSMVDDEYEIEAKLGEGAMGVVYRALHTKLGRRVALKVIAPSMGADPQALGRFEREARALATLRHQNIVDVYSCGTLPDKRSYYSMEFLDGMTLYERLQGERVPIDEGLAVLDQMASALEAAHTAGIVHRDLKPENTFLARLPGQRSAVVKILDWGLARMVVPDGVEKTASGVVIGTCLYISPEQARGPDVDGRTDIYALGVVSYELILGRHPFPHATTSTAAIAAHLTEDPPQPRSIWPEIPAELDSLLPAMLSKNPNYRPTLAEVRDVIASVRSGMSQVRAATAPVARSARYARAWFGGLVALALIVGIVIGARILDRGPSNSEPTRAAGTSPVSAANEADTVATPRAQAIDAAPTIDAGDLPSAPSAPPADAAIADAPSLPKVRPRNTTRSIDAGRSPVVPTSEQPPVVDSTVNTPVSPPQKPTEKRPQQVPPLIDRDGTINPFKRGSAAR